MTTVQEQLHKLVEFKLEELRKAICELRQHTIPHTPLPRPKVFKLFNDEIIWPHRSNDLYTIKVNNRDYDFEYGVENHVVQKICEVCKYQPAKILKVIRRIEAAAEWCRKRAEGRKRAAEEILKQQKKAVDTLTALAVAYKLSKKHKCL